MTTATAIARAFHECVNVHAQHGDPARAEPGHESGDGVRRECGDRDPDQEREPHRAYHRAPGARGCSDRNASAMNTNGITREPNAM